MSIALVRNEIARFLASREPEVLCLRGKWGVGKTFTWKAFLKSASTTAGGIALPRYSYVSLFGIDSVDQLKYAIFENLRESRNVDIEPNVESIRRNAAAVGEQVGRQAFPKVLALFGGTGKELATALQSLGYLSITETLVFIDDLERRGRGLHMRDVLGVIAQLRDQKHCKAVLILNDDGLDDADKEEFNSLNEKVIDESIEFSPAASESAQIAIDGSNPVQVLLREAVTNLGISNIRIIKKIERSVLRIAPRLEDLHQGVLRQAVQSLALLTWSRFGEGAPSEQFLLDKRGKDLFGLNERADITEQDKELELPS